MDVTVDGSETDDAAGRMAELRSVVTYLRKEKEIVDLQLELSKQENARFKTQIDHLARSLEETRTQLSNVSLLLKTISARLLTLQYYRSVKRLPNLSRTPPNMQNYSRG